MSSSHKSYRNCTSNRKYVQTRLKLGFKENTIMKCPRCEMTYSPSSLEDANTHKVYHNLHLKGRTWSSRWGIEVSIAKDIDTAIRKPSSLNLCSQTPSNEHIVMIRPEFPAEVKAAMEILNVVNDELNAPHDENDFWSQPNGQGKAFVYVKEDRAIGVITMEVLEPERGRWMVYKTKNIVDHIRPAFSLGISRIWVCRTERSSGVATKLLEAARENTIYGRTIERWQMAWSQPTDSGGKLASKYNGREHKSGKLLLPCYI